MAHFPQGVGFGGKELAEEINNRSEVKAEPKALTVKALLFGFLGLFFIAAFGKTSTEIWKSGDLMACNLGIAAYFYFFLMCVVWNPLASRFFPQLKLNIKEMAVVLIMSLVAGGFSYVGWMRQLFTQLGYIPSKALSLPSWKEYQILELFNLNIFPNKGVADETVIEGFSAGLGYGKWLNISEVPLYGWANMIYWAPLLLILSFMMLGMLMLVHRQWIKNEKLSYPLATIAESLIHKTDSSKHFADVFRNKLFWWGFGIVFFIYAYNFAAAWYPDTIHAIPMNWYLEGLEGLFPSIRYTSMWNLRNIKLFFMIFGIAYFLSSSLSLTIGLNIILYFLFASQVYYVTGSAPTGVNMDVMRSGAYLAFAFTLVFLGRHFYGPIMLQALGFRKIDEESKEEVAAARLFLICFLAMSFLLMLMGFNLIDAFVFTFICAVLFLVFTRIICESGLPFMQTGWMPITIMPKLFGGSAIGPSSMMLNGLLSGILTMDTRQLLMPYMATGAKLGEDTGMKRRKVFFLMAFSLVIAFAVAFFMNLWEYYSFGVKFSWCKSAGWNVGTRTAVNEIAQLHINGQYETAASASMWGSFSLMSFDGEVWTYFLAGIALVLLMSFLRIRFLWWPIHGLLFCIWNTWPARMIWSSFLMGWIVRSLIVKFGGERNYIKLKPLFIGLIFGEIFSFGVKMFFKLGYYMIYGTESPVSISIFIS